MISVCFFPHWFYYYIIIGGKPKYRVRKKSDGWHVEMRGGGVGPFWGFAHFTPFADKDSAEAAMQLWKSLV